MATGTQAYPSLNDIEPSWADVTVTGTVSGGALIEMKDISALKWSRKVDVGARKGTSGGRTMARTTGEGSQDGSCTFYRSGLRRLVKALIQQAQALNYTRGNQVKIGLVSFDVDIQHTPPGETEIYHTRLKGCRYLSDSDDMKEGSDADTIDVSLNPIEVCNIINGVEVVLV